MAEIPTIQIEDGQGGYLLINQEDFDPSQHRRFNLRQSASPSPAPTPTPAPASAPTVELPPEVEVRIQQLEAIYESEGYRGIQAIAIPLGIEKPEGGWRDAIPLIIEAEGAG
jgi:hypothetical protein